MTSKASTPPHNEATQSLTQQIQALQEAIKKQQNDTAKKIKTLKNYYESILANMPGHVYWIDRDGFILGCNDEQAKSANLTSRLDIIGKTNRDLLPEDQAIAVDAINKQVMESGIPLKVEEYGQLGSTPRYFLSQKAPLFNEKNEVIGLVGTSLDITQQKEAEQALIKAKEAAESLNQAKSTFIANMSHDIRTPLNGVIGMSQLLEERVTTTECKQYARWIHESGNQLMLLLNNILELVSAEQVFEQGIHKETFSLRALIEDIVQLEQPSTLVKQLAFMIDIDPNLPEYIVSDRTKLHRILLNLIGNAIKFTKKGSIELHLRQDNLTETHTTITFSISDTGIGIPKELQTKIFDRFFRLIPSAKGQYNGHGVGLHIVQNFIKILGGTMHLFSEEGKGSTFSFQLTFEIKPDYVGKAIHPETVNGSELFASKPNLTAFPPRPFLLIEDNPIALKLLEHLMEKLGYPYISSVSAEDALEQLQQHSFQLIITDLGLPGLSGIELAKLIRKKTKDHPPLIIGLTAHAPQETFEACIKAGMNTVLTKPVDIKKLEQVMNTFLQVSPEEPVLSSLGRDLPATEAELFQIDNLQLLDVHQAIELLGGKQVLHEMLNLMIHEQIPHDLPLLHQAYEKKDWKQIEALAHKMKAGALYCGTTQLQMASQYLERYTKAGHTACLELLFEQLIRVIGLTEEAIINYLKI